MLIDNLWSINKYIFDGLYPIVSLPCFALKSFALFSSSWIVA